MTSRESMLYGRQEEHAGFRPAGRRRGCLLEQVLVVGGEPVAEPVDGGDVLLGGGEHPPGVPPRGSGGGAGASSPAAGWPRRSARVSRGAAAARWAPSGSSPAISSTLWRNWN